MRWTRALVSVAALTTLTWTCTAFGEARTESAKLAVARVEVDGQLDSDVAKSRLEKGLPKIARCARPAKGREATPVVDALIDLRLLVDEGGRVVGSTVERSTGSSPELDRCVGARAMDVRYPPRKGKGHATVRYGLRFGEGAGHYGILGALRSAPPSSLFGPSGIGTGGLGLKGAAGGGGSGLGDGGLGLKGTGRGGGGTGYGTIGLGKLGTIGHKGRSTPPRVRTGTAEVRGALSREVIRRYIRRHINQVRFCYERELTRQPGLSGRVVVEFVIGPTGAVTSASVASTTLGNADAEQCIVGAVRRIAFPQPDGGGTVTVRYPFELQPAAAP